jgi:hypothetical protein
MKKLILDIDRVCRLQLRKDTKAKHGVFPANRRGSKK